jgi:hypothetical protein
MRLRVLSCFDKLSMIGRKPFALSLSKGAPPGAPLCATHSNCNRSKRRRSPAVSAVRHSAPPGVPLGATHATLRHKSKDAYDTGKGRALARPGGHCDEGK